MSDLAVDRVNKDRGFAMGAVFLVLSELMFVSMGGSIKVVSVYLPNEMVVFFRNIVGVGLLLPLIFHHRRVGLKTHHFGLHIVRALAGLGAMYCFFYAIANLEFAQATVLKMATPLFIPVVAWLWLSESISKPIAGSITLGFMGVLVITRPGLSGVSWAMLIAVLGGLFAAIAKVSVRRLSKTEPTVRIVFYFAVVGTLVSAIPALMSWVVPPVVAWWWVFAIGVFATLGQLFMTRAFGLAPAAKVGAFAYSSILFATLFGWLFWDEGVGGFEIVGALMVFAAGLTMGIAHRRGSLSPV